jgi:uncharacterized protein
MHPTNCIITCSAYRMVYMHSTRLCFLDQALIQTQSRPNLKPVIQYNIMINIDFIVKSPCVRNCCLNNDDVCLGCFRSLDEIKRWSESSNQERIIVLQKAEQRRGAYDLKWGKYTP